MPDDLISNSDLPDILRQILGQDGFIADPETLTLFSQDVWSKGTQASFIARPDSVDALCKAVAAAHERGVSLNPRGGGMSYTSGYTPDRAGVGILDMSALDQIVEVNTQDMYVTVQAGCTWATLLDALKPHGLRTPFWGPLSGLRSTIGGGLSQNNAFFGAGKYGTIGDSVLSIAVVLADGTLVRTGTGGTTNGKPFLRYYGPDLTGLFISDAGALGYKAEITFRLIPAPTHEDWASYDFDMRDAWAAALADMQREDIACEIFGFDPNLTRVRMARASLLSDAKTLGNVMKSQGSLLKGLKEGAKIAMAGRGFMGEANFNMHFAVEGRSEAGVKAEIKILKEICERHGGKAIENSIPKIIRANPFGPMNSMLGPKGERWVPVHGLVAVSDGQAALSDITDLFDRFSEDIERYEILTGYLLTTIGTTGYLIEPVFIWPEEIFEIHEEAVEDDWLAKLGRHEANPDATAFVHKLRTEVVNIFSKYGGAHFQIGRTYPYKEGREDATWRLLEQIKAVVDPQNKINPGALGLG